MNSITLLNEPWPDYTDGFELNGCKEFKHEVAT